MAATCRQLSVGIESRPYGKRMFHPIMFGRCHLSVSSDCIGSVVLFQDSALFHYNLECT